MTGYLSVFVTTATKEEAEKIAHVVVEEKLANCANIIPGIRSVYRWQGKIEHGDECALIVKIPAQGFDALEKRIKQMHSYEFPCIVAWSVEAGNAEFLQRLG